MNYLELTNDFLIETDYSDQVTTVVGLADDELRASIWIRDAWTQIQRQERWSFMAFPATIATVVSQETYQASDFTYASGSHSLGFMSTNFRNNTAETLLIGVSVESLRWSTATGSASKFAINPDRSVKIGPIPTAIESLEMDTWVAPIILAADTDTPAMASQFHKAIVWLAIANYAREQGGEWNGLRQAAHIEYNNVYTSISNAYLPTMGRKVGLDGMTTYRRYD